MSSAAALAPPPVPKREFPRSVIIDESIRIPPEVVDLASFRKWANSESFPERGRISYFQGEIWVDLSMEQLFTHNQVKLAYSVGLDLVLRDDPLGRFFPDGVRLSFPHLDYSTVPDGIFYFFESIRRGLLRRIEGATTGYVELEGTPDMALEIISDTSVHKDTERLHEMYWRVGITEYWRVDVRRKALRFEIFRHRARGYVSTAGKSGWLKSKVFGRSFRLVQKSDELGDPQYVLQVRG